VSVDSFAELGLGEETVEALVSLGIEEPTSFQEQAIPVIRRGNNVIGAAGPGAGTLVAYGAALLDRLASGDAGEPGVRAIVVAPDGHAADRLARSLARLGVALELRVAALGASWVLPQQADLLFASASELLDAVQAGRVSLDDAGVVVVDQVGASLALDDASALGTVFDFLPDSCQRVLLDARPRDGSGAETPAWRFMEERGGRSVHIPPRAVGREERPPNRGRLFYRISQEEKDESGLRLVSEILTEGEVRHVAVVVRGDDRAADVADLLSLLGYVAGAPGDESVPVWVSADERATRSALDDTDDEVTVLSWDAPADPDALDRRHGSGRGGYVLVLPRELPHLRAVARRTGYGVTPAPPPAESRITDDLVRTVEELEGALENEDTGVYMLLLETLFEEHDPAEVAAAAVALLRKRTAEGAKEEAGGGRRGGAGETPAEARRPAWVRLFMSIGKRDGVGPGDIVGAIAGETGVSGSRVGRIEIRDTFSLVDVDEGVAEEVIRGMNGTTVKGRSVRADYDRPDRGGDRSPRSRSSG